MGQDRTLQVRPGTFSGNSKVYSAGPEGLAEQIRSLQAQNGSAIWAAADTTDVTDSSSLAGQTLVTFDFTGGTIENMGTLTSGVLGVPTGHPIILQTDGADLPNGLAAATTYYIMREKISGAISPTIFRLAAEQYQAYLGEAIDIEDDGTGVHWIQRQMALPAQFTRYDSLGDTTGTLDTAVNVTIDTLIELLSVTVEMLVPLQAALGLPVVDVGGTTGGATLVLADVTATANGSDDNAVDYTSAVAIADELNEMIVTTVAHVNDVTAAVGLDEYLDFLNIGGYAEVDEPDVTAIELSTTATSAVGGAVETVSLVEFDAALVDWGAAIANITQRVSVAAAAAQSVDNWTVQLVPEAEAVAATPGLRTRGR
jgi:hypothetical protein